jgi:hypothetical protein
MSDWMCVSAKGYKAVMAQLEDKGLHGLAEMLSEGAEPLISDLVWVRPDAEDVARKMVERGVLEAAHLEECVEDIVEWFESQIAVDEVTDCLEMWVENFAQAKATERDRIAREEKVA